MTQQGKSGSRGELLSALWTFRRELVWVGIFSLFVNVMMLAPTLYMLQVFDRVMVSANEFTLIALTLVTILFVGVMAFAEWLRSRLLVRSGVRFDDFLNARVFSASFDANLNQATHNPVRAFGDLTNLRQFLTGNGVFAIFDTPWTVVYILVLFLMHPILGWISVAFVVGLSLMAWGSSRLTTPRYARASEGQVLSSTYLAGKLRNVETVHAMGMLGNLRRQWLQIYETQLTSQLDAQQLTQRIQALTKFVQYSQQSLILAAGAWLVIRGEMSVGAMIASNALMSNALRPIGVLMGTWKQFADAREAYGRLQTLLDEHPERAGAHAVESVRGQVSLRGLVATATHREAPILKGLDAQFRAGEVIAIVGPSGAGKSTLARCIVGIWPQTSGEVLLDGKPVQSWDREDLGPHVGYLPQDIELFEGTLAENIARFGSIDAAKVIEASRRTGIHEMILRMPQGYDTPMGVAGAMLSAGQRQRVGLARALYGSPELVVLDEPNANLDDVGIAALFRTVQDLRSAGTTVFMIVHQRQLLSAADRVLVLQDGAITQLAQLAQTRTATA